jgi:hypothetical protein
MAAMFIIKGTLFINVRPEVSISETMKYAVFWDVTPVTIATTNVSEEPIAFMIKVKRNSDLGTILAVTRHYSNLRRSKC